MLHISVATLWGLRNTPVAYQYNTQPLCLVTCHPVACISNLKNGSFALLICIGTDQQL